MKRAWPVACAASAVALWISPAFAGPVVASRCSAAEPTCERATLSLSKEVRGPADFDFDTGWLPANSPVQVRFVAALHDRTRVDLGGTLDATWPSAVTLSPKGVRGAGLLAIDDGVELALQARFDVQVAGVNYKWQGNMPGLPGVSLLAKNAVAFDPWAFAGDSNLPTVTATTPLQTLAWVNLTSSIIPIPGISGGFELDGSATFAASYDTLRIGFDELSQQSAAGVVDFLHPTTSELITRAPAFDTTLFVHGEVVRQVSLLLVPAFYFKILGSKFSLPIAQLPVDLPKGAPAPWDFEPLPVHVPLPEIDVARTDVDLGEIALGTAGAAVLPIANLGQDSLIADLESTSTLATFDVPHLDIASNVQAGSRVIVTPLQVGAIDLLVHVRSNDPLAPLVDVRVRGQAVEPGAASSPVNQDAGCGCQQAGLGAQGRGAWLALGVAAALVARRRANRPLKQRPASLSSR